MIIALIITGICIIPAICNTLFAYFCFKRDNRGKEVTVEDFVIFLDEELYIPPFILMIFPGASLAVLIILLMYMLLMYPTGWLIQNWYEKNKHRKI